MADTALKDVPATPSPQELAEAQKYADALNLTLKSDGWQQIIQPGIKAMRDMHLSALVAGSVTDDKGRPISDEQCRAIIKTLNWMLEWETRRDFIMQDLVNAQNLVIQQNPVYEGGSPAAPQPAV